MNSNQQRPEGKDFLEAQMLNAFTSIGFMNGFYNNLQNANLSVLWTACNFYRKMVTGIGLTDKAKIPRLIQVAGNHSAFSPIHQELLNFDEILFEFYKLGNFRDELDDLNEFLRSDGSKREYDGHEALLLKNRLMQSIERLRTLTTQMFNVIDFSKINITMGTTTTNRDFLVITNKATLQVDFPKYSKQDLFFNNGKTGTGSRK